MYNHSDFQGSPKEVAEKREQALSEGLVRLGAKYGLTFESVRRMNPNGDFSLTLTRIPYGHPQPKYGEEFAKILSKYGVFCGNVITHHMHANDNWCYMNHFTVETMLEELGI